MILSYFPSFFFFFRKHHVHFVNCKYSGKCISSPPPPSTSRFIHLFNFARAFPPLTHVWKNWKQVERRVGYILVHKYISKITNHRFENSNQKNLQDTFYFFVDNFHLVSPLFFRKKLYFSNNNDNKTQSIRPIHLHPTIDLSHHTYNIRII